MLYGTINRLTQNHFSMSSASEILNLFRQRLKQEYEYQVRKTSISRNIFDVTKVGSVLLYVKVRTQEPHKWGITANVVNRLKQQEKIWFVVLLFETEHTGYLLNEADVDYYISNSIWPLAGDGDYKPAAGTYLEKNIPFKNLDQMVR